MAVASPTTTAMMMSPTAALPAARPNLAMAGPPGRAVSVSYPPPTKDLALYLPPPPAPETVAEWLYFRPKTPANTNKLVANPQAGLPNDFAPPSQAPNPLPNPGAFGLGNKKKNPEAEEPPENNEGDKKEDKGLSPGQLASVNGFDASIIRNLNARLEDLDDFGRVRAANDFVQIMMNSPAITTDPDYKPYTDAFALKILRDPMAPVHQPMLLAIESGYYINPSPEVMFELEKLRRGDGLLGLEPQNVEDALFALRLYQERDAKNNIVPTNGELRQKRPKNPAVSKLAQLDSIEVKPPFRWPWHRGQAGPQARNQLPTRGQPLQGLSTPPLVASNAGGTNQPR